MKLSNIANVIDVEHDNGRLIEIGLTTVALKERQILQSYSLAIKPDFELSPEVATLTGWTSARLLKCGMSKEEASRRLDSYGSNNRLLVTDHSDEIPFLENALRRTLSLHRLNVSILIALLTGLDINLGLEKKLALYDMKFEGKPHSGVDDSRNIARLFLKLLRMPTATKLPAKTHTEEQQIDCEIAGQIIADYFVMCAKQLAEEKDNSSPNQEKIKALETKLSELHREKMELGADTADLIKKALDTYARILKEAKV